MSWTGAMHGKAHLRHGLSAISIAGANDVALRRGFGTQWDVLFDQAEPLSTLMPTMVVEVGPLYLNMLLESTPAASSQDQKLGLRPAQALCDCMLFTRSVHAHKAEEGDMLGALLTHLSCMKHLALTSHQLRSSPWKACSKRTLRHLLLTAMLWRL